MRFLLGVAFLIISVVAQSSAFPARADEVIPVESVGQLVMLDSWKPVGVCTGWVAGAIRQERRGSYGEDAAPQWINIVVTAGHCVRGADRWTFKGMTAWRVRAFSADYDVAILEFESSSPLPVLPFARVDMVEDGDRVMLVGYGRRSLMARVGTVVGRDAREFIMVDSTASPGNSGGPVIDVATGIVVGVGVEVTIKPPVRSSPIYCMIAPCAPVPPYYATPASNLRGLIMWEGTR